MGTQGNPTGKGTNSLVIVHLRLVFVPPDLILDDCQLSLEESILLFSSCEQTKKV